MEFINQNATCLDCGYRLAGLESRNCPECGRYFDPLNATTFNDGASPSGWRRWAKPPSRMECLTIAGLTFIGIVVLSGPALSGAGLGCFAAVFGIPVWIGTFVVYIRRVFATRRDAERAAQDLDRPKHTLRWLVAPCCALIFVSTMAAPWPMILRFRLSESSFKQALKDHKSGAFQTPRWVGAFYVDDVIDFGTRNGGTSSVGFVTGLSLIDPVGFTYDPSPTRKPTAMSVRVAPFWYTFED